MAEKSISLSELKKLRDDGAEIEFEPEVTKIEQFSDLIDQLKLMVANESERIRADIARNQTNLEILATLQALVRKQGQAPSQPAVDLSPIKELLEDLRAEREARERASYEFDIQRDGRGFAHKITAKPVGPTTH